MACVLKHNACGLGVETLGSFLYSLGCRSFYVCSVEEGQKLAEALKGTQKSQSFIWVLSPGPLTRKSVETMDSSGLFPVLSSTESVIAYRQLSLSSSCALRMRVGHNTLGFSVSELLALATSSLQTLSDLTFLAHLPNAEEAQDKRNAQALQECLILKKHFPQARFSLSATAGALLGQQFFLDEVRIGVGVMGALGSVHSQQASDFQEKLSFPFRLQTYIMNKRSLRKDEAVGYGCRTLSRNASGVFIGIGYANGLPIHDMRSNDAILAQEKNTFFIKSHHCELIPQTVSMYFSAMHVQNFDDFSINEEIDIISDRKNMLKICNAEGVSYSALVQRMSRAGVYFV